MAQPCLWRCHSASWLGEPLARTLGASHGPALLLQLAASARLSWLQDGWVRHSRQVGPAGRHQPGAGFFASQPDYPAHGIPTLWQTGEDDSLVHHPALAGFQRQQAPLESRLAGLAGAHSCRQPGDYRWPPGTSRPQLGQCSPRSRRLTLAISLAAAVLGGGWFAWGEALNRQAAQLAEHTRALHASNQQLAASLGPAEVTQARRAAPNSLLILRTRWPRLGDDLDALAEQRPAGQRCQSRPCTGAPTLPGSVRAVAPICNWNCAPTQPFPPVRRWPSWSSCWPPAGKLAGMPRSATPFDTRAEATCTAKARSCGLSQLVLPARKAGQ